MENIGLDKEDDVKLYKIKAIKMARFILPLLTEVKVYDVDADTSYTDFKNIYITNRVSDDEKVFHLLHECLHIILKHKKRLKKYKVPHILKNITADVTANELVVKIYELNNENVLWSNYITLKSVKEMLGIEKEYTGELATEPILEWILDNVEKDLSKVNFKEHLWINNSDDDEGDDNGKGRGEEVIKTDEKENKSDVQENENSTNIPNSKVDSLKEEYEDGDKLETAIGSSIMLMDSELRRFIEKYDQKMAKALEKINIILTQKVDERKIIPMLRRESAVFNRPIFWTSKEKTLDLTLVFDSSGSIGELVDKFISSSRQFIKENYNYRIIICDDRIRYVTEDFEKIKVNEFQGGTDFRPPFEYLKRKNIKTDLLIYFTDLYGPLPNSSLKPSGDVYWVVVNNKSPEKPPFGKVIKV